MSLEENMKNNYSDWVNIGKMEDSINEVMTELRQTFKTKKTLPFSFRMEQLKNLLKMLEENETELLLALEKDLRRPPCESRQYDIMCTKVEICEAIRQLRHWMKPNFSNFNALIPLDTCYTKNEPYGVVLILGTWNYPTNLTISPLVGAIAAGNCALIKPSEVSPSCSSIFSKLISRYLDPTCYRVIEGGVRETTILLSEKFDYIFMTGSTQVGKIVMSAAAKNLTPVTLELGGKSPVYIDDEVNLDLAVKRILWGKFINGGQTCIAPDYIICSKKIEEQLIPIARKYIKQFYGSDLQSSPSLSRVVNTKHFRRLKALLDGTKGEIVIGGNCDEDDLWIEPTIVVNVTESDILMDDEIFGPILPIVNIESKEAALEFISTRPGKPLALYVFTNKKNTAQLFREQSASGSLAINDVVMQFAMPGLSFGGVDSSGMGNYHGKASYDTFSQKRSVIVRDFSFVTELISSLRYAPYEHVDFKVNMTYFLIKNFYRFTVPSLKLSHIFMFLLGVLTTWYLL